MNIWLLIPTGFGAGLLAGLLGVGGGLILVPIFFEYFTRSGGLTPEKSAIGTSHMVIFMASITSVFTHSRQNVVDWRRCFQLFMGALMGIGSGATLVSLTPGPMIRTLFALLIILVALKTLAGVKPKVGTVPSSVGIDMFAGFVIGLFSSFFGVGGGILAVPYLVRFSGKSLHDAVATSAGFILLSAAASTIAFSLLANVGGTGYSLGFVDVQVAGITGLSALVGARVGAKLSKKINEKPLRLIFCILLFVVAIRLILKNFF